MSEYPEQEYFSDGITEDIITALSRSPWLFVISRNSSFVCRGTQMDIKIMSRELGVRYILEGSVRKAGNRVRVTAQLIFVAMFMITHRLLPESMKQQRLSNLSNRTYSQHLHP